MNYFNFFFNLLKIPLRFIRFIYSIENLNKSESNIIETLESPKKILTWNIHELFLYTNFNKVKNIINRINNFDSDLICLQEAFEDETKRLIIEETKKKYPYFMVTTTEKKIVIGEDSGLLILSKYPINFVFEKCFENLFFPDSLANKSVLYFTVGNLNFATTHLQSGYESISECQIKDILKNSPFEKFILLGDLNNRNVDDILNIDCNNKEVTFYDEIIDYILPINWTINLKVDVLRIDLDNTSDHYPLEAKILNY